MVSKNTIIDLCGGTGSWSEPYRLAGYRVFVVTLPDHDVTAARFETGDDGRELLVFPSCNSSRPIILNVQSIYGVLAAPPCTEFSRAKVSGQRDLLAGMQTVTACVAIVHGIELRGGRLEFWALENPEGMLRRFLGNPPLSFEPWHYGDRHTKQTDIWGRFKEPRRLLEKKPAKVKGMDARLKNHIGLAKGFGPGAKMSTTAALRSVTPGGFATAFFRSNSQTPGWWMERYGLRHSTRARREHAAAVGQSDKSLSDLAGRRHMCNRCGRKRYEREMHQLKAHEFALVKQGGITTEGMHRNNFGNVLWACDRCVDSRSK